MSPREITETTIPLADRRTAAPPHPVPTWQIFAALTVLNIALGLYVKEFVLTRELYLQLFGDRLDSATIDEIFGMIRKSAVLGYAVSPLVVALRVVFFSLMLQLALLIVLVEIPLSRLFRIVCCAYFLPLLGTAVQWISLSRADPASVTERDLRYVPGSIADLMDPAAADTWLYTLMTRCSVAELAFGIAIVVGLVETGTLKPAAAIAVTSAVWLSINLLKWAITFFVQGMAPS